MIEVYIQSTKPARKGINIKTNKILEQMILIFILINTNKVSFQATCKLSLYNILSCPL